MKWKLFWQIVLLIIFIAIVFYIVFPKYYFIRDFSYNRITGKVIYKYSLQQQLREQRKSLYSGETPKPITRDAAGSK